MGHSFLLSFLQTNSERSKTPLKIYQWILLPKQMATGQNCDHYNKCLVWPTTWRNHNWNLWINQYDDPIPWMANILITENDAVNYIPWYSVFVLVKHEITMNLPTLHRLSHILVVSSMKSYSKRIWSGFPLSKAGCQSGKKWSDMVTIV